MRGVPRRLLLRRRRWTHEAVPRRDVRQPPEPTERQLLYQMQRGLGPTTARTNTLAKMDNLRIRSKLFDTIFGDVTMHISRLLQRFRIYDEPVFRKTVRNYHILNVSPDFTKFNFMHFFSLMRLENTAEYQPT